MIDGPQVCLCSLLTHSPWWRPHLSPVVTIWGSASGSGMVMGERVASTHCGMELGLLGVLSHMLTPWAKGF